MKKTVAILLALMMGATLLAGCGTGGGAGGGTGPATTAPTRGGDLMVCIAPDPETLDPGKNSTVDGATICQNAFSGLYAWDVNDKGAQILVPDCAEAVVEPTEIEDGKYRYVITLKPGLKWSDGQALKASDFVYAWNRAVDPLTMADYQYIFDVIDGYDADNPALNIKADDSARTVTVVTAAYCAYFNQLMAFPTYFPVRQDIVEANPDTWATSVDTYVTNGAFKIADWVVGSRIKFVPNENYWNADAVMLDSLTYALSDDSEAIFANFENGTYQFIRNLPVSQIPILKETRLDKDFIIGDYIGTYFLEFNVEYSLKPGLATAGKMAADWQGWTPDQNAQARRALSLLIDRNYIVDDVTMSGEIPAFGFVPKGMDDGTGTEFRSKAEPWWKVGYDDYEANCNEAVEILRQWYRFDEATGKFTDFPVFEYSINPNSRNLAICAAVQDMWNDYGITTTVDNRAWAVITTAVTEGDFVMSRMGWIADYNDPVNFLEIYVSASGNNHPRLGKAGSVGGSDFYGTNRDQTWDEAYEALIAQIKTTSDAAARADAMYKAEAVLRDTYTVLPVFYYTEPYMASQRLHNYIHSPLGFVIFRYATLAP
jgi:oligopeptide transport system substrate-binding protein